jgi:type III secretion protein T
MAFDLIEALRTGTPDQFIVTTQQAMSTMLLSAARITTIFVLMPTFSRTVITGIVRTGIVLSISLFMFPVVYPAVDLSISYPTVVALIFKESAIGFLIGYSIGALFWGVEGAGFFIDNQRGSAMAGSIDPLSGSDTTPMGILFMQAYVSYFFVSGSFLVFLGLLYDSYVAWPVTSFWPQLPPDTPRYALGVADRVMYLAVVFAGPLTIAMFLAEFGLALVSRFAPQLNVFVLAMPVKSGVGLFVLALYIPFLFSYLRDGLLTMPSIFEAIGRLIE